MNFSVMCLSPENYPVVWYFKNDTKSTMTLYLEMVPEEVVLEIGDEVELLARPSDGLLPLDIAVVEGGFQVHAYQDMGPKLACQVQWASDQGQELDAPCRLSVKRILQGSLRALSPDQALGLTIALEAFPSLVR
jgi:hypothetical protein